MATFGQDSGKAVGFGKEMAKSDPYYTGYRYARGEDISDEDKAMAAVGIFGGPIGQGANLAYRGVNAYDKMDSSADPSGIVGGGSTPPQFQAYQAPWAQQGGGLQDAWRIGGDWSNKINPAGLEDLYAGTKRGSSGLTPWEALALKQQQTQQTTELGNLGQQQASQAAQARAGLAAKGGLRGGTAERLGTQIGRQGLLEQQNLGRQGLTSRMGIGMQAEDKRISTLSEAARQQAAVQQQNAANEMRVREFDIGTMKNRSAQEEQSRQFGLGQQNKLFAGQEERNAMAELNKKKGLWDRVFGG
jgi:hypothetical protein